MPPPSLSTHDDGEVERPGGRAEEAVAVVEEGDVADQQRRRAARRRAPPRPRSTRRRRCRWRRGWPAPAPRRGARPYHSRSRIGIDDDTTSVAPSGRAASERAGPPPARSARGWPSRTASMAAWARSSARCQRASHGVPVAPFEPLGQLAAHVGRVGDDPRRRPSAPGRSRPRAADLDLHGARGGQPLVQHLGGGRRPEAEHDTPGVWSAAKAGWRRMPSKAATVVGRRQPGTRPRVGQDRPLDGGRQPVHGVGVAAAPAGHDHAPLVLEAPGEGVERRRRRAAALRRRRRATAPVGTGRRQRAGLADQRVAERQVQVDRARPAGRSASSDGPRRPATATWCACASSGTPGSANQRTARPYRWLWSIVCGAPTSRSSGGRSAVHTSSGTSAWWASTTAAWSSAAAVPLVVSTTAGRPVARPRPRARNDADRSSWWTCSRMPGAAARARASGRGAGAGRHDGVGHAGPDPLVDQRGAERGCGGDRHDS